MEPQNTNEEMHPDMTPDEAMANLAFATHLQDSMLHLKHGSNEQQEVPESTEMEETVQPTADDIMGEIQDLKGQIQDLKQTGGKDEISAIREELKALLKSDE